MPDVVRSDFSRVFLIENRASPFNAPAYKGLWRAMGPTWGQGDNTVIYRPSPNQYGAFDNIATVPGEPKNPTLPVQAIYELSSLSDLIRLVRNGCEHDLQVHFGKCRDPRDFNGGWEKVLIIEAGRITDYSGSELGALEPSQRGSVTEDATFSGADLYEVKRIIFGTKAASEVAQEIIDITICDQATCGLCGLASDGCQTVIALTVSNGGSPGAAAKVIFTEDGGATWSSDLVFTLAPTEDPKALACVGTDLIVISNASCSLHWAPLAEVLVGTAVWGEVTTGFVCPAGAPNAIFTAGPTYTWIVGNGGYIYFSDDPSSGVTVQDAGSATTQNLNSVHGLDELNVLAVGANNAVVYTADGGATWVAVTGPAVGVALNACWMKSTSEWLVGTATGRLYVTRDTGATWVEKSFPGSGAGAIKDIKFSTDTVGYMAHNTAAPLGRILRTLDGGYSWYVAPEGSSTIPTNQGINAVAVCVDPNVVYGGGVTVVGGDGIIVASS